MTVAFFFTLDHVPESFRVSVHDSHKIRVVLDDNIYSLCRACVHIYLDHVLLCHVIFVCVCCGEEYKDSKMAIEKYVAWKTRALFWRNGRAFKEPKANVQEPEGIENIEPSIKKVIDQMIGNFNK